jgi:hypothetical protein
VNETRTETSAPSARTAWCAPSHCPTSASQLDNPRRRSRYCGTLGRLAVFGRHLLVRRNGTGMARCHGLHRQLGNLRQVGRGPDVLGTLLPAGPSTSRVSTAANRTWTARAGRLRCPVGALPLFRSPVPRSAGSVRLRCAVFPAAGTGPNGADQRRTEPPIGTLRHRYGRAVSFRR